MEKGSLYAHSLNPFAITDDGRDVSFLVPMLICSRDLGLMIIDSVRVAVLHFG